LQQVSTTQDRQKEKRTDDLLAISDRDQLTDALYMAAAETGRGGRGHMSDNFYCLPPAITRIALVGS
jgi:hypothetical protein